MLPVLRRKHTIHELGPLKTTTIVNHISKKKKESRRRPHVLRRLMRPVRLGESAETLCVPNVHSFLTSRQDVNFMLNVVPTSSCAT